MTDHDFLDALSHRREYYRFAKEAVSPEAVQLLKKLAPAALGALALTGLQAMSNVRGRTGKSVQQRLSEKAERSAKVELEAAKREGRKPTFMEEARGATAPALSRLADVATRHPVKAALPAAIPGAVLGTTIAKYLK